MPETKVVALTALDDEKSVQEAFKAGFHGYLTKQTETERFTQALRSVEDGQMVFPQRKIGRIPGTDGGGAPCGAAHDPRDRGAAAPHGGRIERSHGRTARVSPNTVRTHVQGILSKLQVHSRLEAAAFAVRHGLVKPRT